MLKPLITMAHVLLLFIVSVQAQNALDKSNKLCLIGLNQTPQNVDLYIAQTKPVIITCSKEESTVSIPKYVQFSCSEGSTFITVEVNITDGTHNQIITKEFEITEGNSSYEMPVLNYVSNEILQNERAHIKSIVFNNNLIASVLLNDISFSNSTLNYEVKMNQVFTIDLTSNAKKKYFISAGSQKEVNINLYKSNGAYDHSVSKSLVKGENFIQFSDMEMDIDKYVVVITDVYSNKKSPNSKITVMY